MSDTISFREVKLESGWLMVKPIREDVGKAMNVVRKHKDKLYDLTIKMHSKKRSLDANAKLWALILGVRMRCCGCSPRNKTHGESRTRLYTIWNDMRQRCGNINHPQYADYGGRGICVCPEWHDYQNFRNWALKNCYSDNLSIDRINNHLGYYPGNCRWVTAREQANNTRKTRLITYNG